MRICVVPMKPLAKAKQRLSEAFSPEDRKRLSLAMMMDVASAGMVLDQTWVICSDQEAVEAARDVGAVPVPDLTPEEGLNASIAATTASAREQGVTGMLLVSADCPATRPEDVAALALGPGVALCPDRTLTGTNALWREPCDVIPTWFGRMSRRAHQGLAYANRIPFARVPRERVAVDLDRPSDIPSLLQLGVGHRTREVLASLGYPHL